MDIKLALFLVFFLSFNLVFSQKNDIPTSTIWMRESLSSYGNDKIDNTFLIYCPNTSKKGTGFLIHTGHIITNAHVIKGEKSNYITAISSEGNRHYFVKTEVDTIRDLAILYPVTKFKNGFLVTEEETVEVGEDIFTFGFPLGYNGPSPILTKGFIAGFKETSSKVKHLIINAAINPGNSGGALFDSKNRIIGIVVSKHAPIPEEYLMTIDIISKNRSGYIYNRTKNGKTDEVSESALIAEILMYFRDMTQTVIGEAIAVSELRTFLLEKGIKI